MCQNAHLHKKYRIALQELQLSGDKLEEEIGNLHHELKRVRDGIERMYGLPHALEQKAKQLSSNIDLYEGDLKENQKQKERISKQIGSLQNYENNDL